MNNLFTRYEFSLLAKYRGFKNPCLAWYNANDPDSVETGYCSNKESWLGGKHCAALLYQQLLDWFREEHFIRIKDFTDANYDGGTGFIVLYKDIDSGALIELKLGDTNYYGALDKAIKAAFDIMPNSAKGK